MRCCPALGISVHYLTPSLQWPCSCLLLFQLYRGGNWLKCCGLCLLNGFFRKIPGLSSWRLGSSGSGLCYRGSGGSRFGREGLAQLHQGVLAVLTLTHTEPRITGVHAMERGRLGLGPLPGRSLWAASSRKEPWPWVRQSCGRRSSRGPQGGLAAGTILRPATRSWGQESWGFSQRLPHR